jgi:pyrroloquinoline-quinone synthase
MTRTEFWRTLSELLEKRDLLLHPFYRAWRGGALSVADLREYACEYYHQVAFFSVYLEEFAARLPEGELKKRVLANLGDEVGTNAGNARAHNLLWIDFAVGTGAVPGELFRRKPLPEVLALIETFLTLSKSGSAAEVLAAFLVYESQVPAIAREKAEWLAGHYGLDAIACRYFTLHATLDIAHAEVWREELDKALDHSRDFRAALAAADRAATALWRALDGIDARRNAAEKETPATDATPRRRV